MNRSAVSRDRSMGNPTFGFPLPLGSPFLFPFSRKDSARAVMRSSCGADDMRRQAERDACASQLDHRPHSVGGVKAVRLPRCEARLGAEALGATRRVAGREAGDEAVEAAAKCSSDLAQRRELRSPRSFDPLGEPALGPGRRAEAAIDAGERLLEQAGAVDQPILLRQVGEALVLGRCHIPRVAQQRPTQVRDARASTRAAARGIGRRRWWRWAGSAGSPELRPRTCRSPRAGSERSRRRRSR